MNIRLALVSLLLPSTSLIAGPGGHLQKSTALPDLLDRFERAYVERTLASIDSYSPRPFKVIIENSISGDLEFQTFGSFKEFERWLVSREVEGFPRREVRKRFRLRNGYAVYDNQGIQHNTLYLNQVNWLFTRHGPVITKIFLYDGN